MACVYCNSMNRKIRHVHCPVATCYLTLDKLTSDSWRSSLTADLCLFSLYNSSYSYSPPFIPTRRSPCNPRNNLFQTRLRPPMVASEVPGPPSFLFYPPFILPTPPFDSPLYICGRFV